MPEPVPPDGGGAEFLTEIRQQPQALRALLEHERDYARVATRARERGAKTVRMVGHGSSDNAPSYGAPFSIHSSKALIFSSANFGFLSGIFGSSSCRTNRNNRLSFPLNGTTTKPSAPPFNNPSRVTMFNSAFTLSPP